MMKSCNSHLATIPSSTSTCTPISISTKSSKLIDLNENLDEKILKSNDLNSLNTSNLLSKLCIQDLDEDQDEKFMEPFNHDCNSNKKQKIQKIIPNANGSISNQNFNLTPPQTPKLSSKNLKSSKSKSNQPSLNLSLAKKSNLNWLKSNLSPLTPNNSPKIKSSCSNLTKSQKILSNHSLHPIFLKNYIIHHELGCGGFGFVVQATQISNKLNCAVKFIYKNKIPNHAWVNDQFWGDENNQNGISRSNNGIKRIPLEAYVLKTIKHGGVVKFLDLFEDSCYIYLVMEHHGTPWLTDHQKENISIKSSQSLINPNSIIQQTSSTSCSSSSSSLSSSSSIKPLKLNLNQNFLHSNLKIPSPFSSELLARSSCDLFECIEQYNHLSENCAKYVFAQLIDIVGCLHYNGFVHRDIKDENIVIDDKFKVKLIDFGSTYLFDYRQEPQTLTRFYGTLNFAAPELVKKGSYQPIAAEIWSLGILLCILVTGESFFHDTDSIKNYKASKPNVQISNDCLDLIFKCLAYNPEDRWNCFKIRQHPWLTDCGWLWSEIPLDACLESVKRVRKISYPSI